MALTIEDGTQVAGANSYISVVDAETLADEYGLALDNATAETNLKAAYKWLNTLEDRLQGKRLSDVDTATSQTGVYPRKPVYLRGNLIDENTIPQELIDAQVLAAFANESSSILLPTISSTTGGVKREHLEGVGEQEYYDGASLDSNETNASLQLALDTLSPLFESALGGAFGGFSIRKNYS